MGQYCTFHVADLHFGVEVERVQEVLRHQCITRVPLADEVVRGLINLRGEIVTALDLRRRLGLADGDSIEELMNVVVRTPDGGAVSFLVDRIGDVVDVPSSQSEAPPETLDGVTRALVRSICKLDGSLLLILDTIEALKFTNGEERQGSN